MFLGTYTPSLDDKGRLLLPAKFRDELRGGLVITKGQEHCLYVFTSGRVRRLAEGAVDAPLTSESARDSSRILFASASDEQTRTGRAASRSRPSCGATPGCSKDCVVIGANTRAEIWDAAGLAALRGGPRETFAKAQEEVLPGVLC